MYSAKLIFFNKKMKNIRSIKLDADNIIIAMLSSAVIGVAISYGDLYLFHVLLGCLFCLLYTSDAADE